MGKPSKTPAAGRLTLLLRIVAGVLLLLLLWFLYSHYEHEAFMRWKQQVGPLPFFIAMALLPALGFPMTPFFIVAGATFGLKLALLGSMLALAINFSLCFWIAHGAMRQHVLKLLKRFNVQMPEFDQAGGGALRLVLLVKFAPGVPAFAKNYLLGVAAVPFGLYLGLSMLITGIYGVGFIVLGESLIKHDPIGAGTALLLLALAAVIIGWVLHRRRRAADSV